MIACLWESLSRNSLTIIYNVMCIVQHTYPPWSWVPVWVVVSLLGALIATPSSSIVLSCVNGRHSLKVTVGCVESLVSLPQSTVEVVVVVLVHAILQVCVAVSVVALVLVLRNGAVSRRGGKREGGGRERGEGERGRGREREREREGGKEGGREGGREGGGEC